MSLFRVLAFGALLVATPALAEDWRVESVTGDAVATRAGAAPDSLDVGSIVPVGSTVVSGPQTTVTLRRGDDVVSFDANAVVEFPVRIGDARAIVAPAVGDFQFVAAGSDTGPLEIVTKWFRADTQTARFSVKARKDGALLEVASGVVDLHDGQRVGAALEIKAGGSFRGVPAPKTADAKDADPAKGAKAGADVNEAAVDDLAKKLPKGGKMTKRQSDLAKKLAAQGVDAVKQGLDAMADDADGDPPPESPRIGLLDYLFGKDAPNTGAVLGVIAVIFAGFGALTATLLRGVSFGTLGNGLILLAGAFAGAAVHDYTCPPALMWNYEPTACIVIVTSGAFLALLYACFLRRFVGDRMEAAATEAARARANAAMRRGLR